MRLDSILTLSTSNVMTNEKAGLGTYMMLSKGEMDGRRGKRGGILFVELFLFNSSK